MVTTDDTAPGHTLFLAWLNTQLDAVNTAAPYEDLVQEVRQQLEAGETARLVLLEIYAEDAATLVGVLVVTALGTDNQRLTYFDGSGAPVAYNVGDSGGWLDVDSRGLVAGFSEGGTATLTDENGNYYAEAGLFTGLLWGTRLPFVHLENGTGPIGKALLDVFYPERGGGSYAVGVDPTTEQNSYTVTNVSGQVLDLAVPLFRNYTLRRRLIAGETMLVPVTATSTYRLEHLRQQALVTYLRN
jgi:hypothetical protein